MTQQDIQAASQLLSSLHSSFCRYINQCRHLSASERKRKIQHQQDIIIKIMQSLQ